MKIILIGTGGVLLLLLLFAWVCSHIRYCITPRYLQILLFGLRLRQIELASIQEVSKRKPRGIAETWYNTVHPSHRTLLLRRSSGWCKYFVISPRNRYIFKTDLERAIDNLKEGGDKPKTERIMIVSD